MRLASTYKARNWSGIKGPNCLLLDRACSLCFSDTFPHSESTFGPSGPLGHEFHSSIPLEHHYQFLSRQRRDGHRPASCNQKSNNVPRSPNQNSWLSIRFQQVYGIGDLCNTKICLTWKKVTRPMRAGPLISLPLRSIYMMRLFMDLTGQKCIFF